MADEKKCVVCGAGSQDRVLLVCESQGKEGHVCVRCLPRLIHG